MGPPTRFVFGLLTRTQRKALGGMAQWSTSSQELLRPTKSFYTEEDPKKLKVYDFEPLTVDSKWELVEKIYKAPSK